jgi:hypothetical protein
MNESRVLIHIWEMLDPAQEGAAVQHLDKMFREIAADPGLISARCSRAPTEPRLLRSWR